MNRVVECEGPISVAITKAGTTNFIALRCLKEVTIQGIALGEGGDYSLKVVWRSSLIQAGLRKIRMM